MVLNDLVDSFCYSQKNAGLKGLSSGHCSNVSFQWCFFSVGTNNVSLARELRSCIQRPYCSQNDHNVLAYPVQSNRVGLSPVRHSFDLQIVLVPGSLPPAGLMRQANEAISLDRFAVSTYQRTLQLSNECGHKMCIYVLAQRRCRPVVQWSMDIGLGSRLGRFDRSSVSALWVVLRAPMQSVSDTFKEQ